MTEIKHSFKVEEFRSSTYQKETVALLVEYDNAIKAFQLCCLLIEKYRLTCIFLYGKGVLNIHHPEWLQFAKQNQIPFLACINSLEKEKISCSHNHIAGLSTFIAHAIESDHTFQVQSDEEIHLNYH